jgi:hypothetical protein
MPTNEIKDFLDKPLVKFETYSKSSSIKTNILLFSKNWQNLNEYLKNLTNFLKWLKNSIDMSSIIQDIAETFQNSKTSIGLPYSLSIDETNLQTINGVTYKIFRVNDFMFEITNLSNQTWVVDKLIVQVKTSDGVIVYPAITTKTGKITLTFLDGLSSNYEVIIV